MLFGPVFQLELVTTVCCLGDRTLVRCGYGLVLLFVLALCGQALTSDLSQRPGGPTTVTIREDGRVRRRDVLDVRDRSGDCLHPAAHAGLDRRGDRRRTRQRKMLYDLLTTRLTSSEIVLGKLALHACSMSASSLCSACRS